MQFVCIILPPIVSTVRRLCTSLWDDGFSNYVEKIARRRGGSSQILQIYGLCVQHTLTHASHLGYQITSNTCWVNKGLYSDTLKSVFTIKV